MAFKVLSGMVSVKPSDLYLPGPPKAKGVLFELKVFEWQSLGSDEILLVPVSHYFQLAPR